MKMSLMNCNAVSALAAASVFAFLANASFVLANPLRQTLADIGSTDASHQLSTNSLRANGLQNNKCLSGWMWFNNKCWVATTSRRDWQHSIELCKRLYGDSTLPTIHSEEENEFLKNNVDLRNSPIWLFARHNHQYNNTRWYDSTKVNYTRWDAGQPSEKSSMVCIKTEDNWYMRKTEPTNGNTECVSFWEDAKWSTSVGCSVLLPVVCEMKLSSLARHQSLSDANQNGSNALPSEGLTSALSSASSNFFASSLVPSACLLAFLLTFKLGSQHRPTTSVYGEPERW